MAPKCKAHLCYMYKSKTQIKREEETSSPHAIILQSSAAVCYCGPGLEWLHIHYGDPPPTPASHAGNQSPGRAGASVTAGGLVFRGVQGKVEQDQRVPHQELCWHKSSGSPPPPPAEPGSFCITSRIKS